MSKNMYTSVTEAAQILNIAPRTIRKWCREGKIHGAMQPNGSRGKWFIHIQGLNNTLEEWEAEQYEQGQTDTTS